MAKSTKPIYEDQFYGIDRRLDPDKLGDGFSTLAVNVELDRIGTVRKRKGQQAFGTLGTGVQPVQALIEYILPSGETQPQMVRNGTVYKYDFTTSSSVVIANNQFSSLSQVQSETFKNRVYYCSENETLRWTNGTIGNLTEVGDVAENKIKAKCMAVGQRTLFVGGVTFGQSNSQVTYPDRVYYSRFDTDKNEESDVFWNAEDETGLGNSTRYFRVEGGIVQCIISFANRNRVFIFSDTRCYAFDVNQVETNPFGALIEIFPIGCAGPKSAVVIDGVLYFMDKQAKIWAWSGNSSRPEELSFNIDDEGFGQSVISQIDKSEENISKVCAFGVGKKVYFSVGNISIDGKTLNNACIKLSSSQNGLRANISIDTFPDRILCGATITVNDQKVLLVGNSNSSLLLNRGLNDLNLAGESVAIDSYYRTKSFHFGFPFGVKKIKQMMIKYKPTEIESYLEVAVSLDGNTGFNPLTKPKTEPSRFGQINMYDDEYLNLGQKISKLNIPNELQAFTLAFEFRNQQKDETFEISTFGFESVIIEDSNLTLQ
jgi:hypothetical protein